MSDREDWPKSLPDEVDFIAGDAPLNPHERAVLRRAAALLREQEREPDAMCHATNWRAVLDQYGDLTVRRYDPDECRDGSPPWPVYIGTPPTSTSEGAVERNRPGCGICGGRLVTIRPRYNDVGGQDRDVCPTCLADRMEQIRTIADPQTYQPMQAEPESED